MVIAPGTTLPKVVEHLTFKLPDDRAVWSGSAWRKNTTVYQNTKETPLDDATVETFDPSLENQKEANQSFVEEFKAKQNAYESLEPVGDIDTSYLAYASYIELDYAYAKKYYDNNLSTTFSACSALVKHNILMRNYDWKYSNACGFVVRTPAINNRHAVLGVVGQVEGLTKDFVKSGKNSELYKLVPFALADGKNDAGLKMTINVVPNDKGNTTDTNPGKEKINALMFVRYALDNCASVAEVEFMLANNISVYVPQIMRDQGYEVHFLVSDDTETKVLEFVNNQVK